MSTYDYVIVGAGFFGAVFAREATDQGKRCLVIDSRNHIGGNCYTEHIEGICVHKYGPHIFHTDDDRIWAYVQRFGSFHRYLHAPVANFRGELFSLPFNMWTFRQLWGVTTPTEALERLARARLPRDDMSNVEGWALANLGEEIYEKFIRGYTLKQWQKEPRELPASIVKRLPVRFSYDNSYFDDRYQGIPVDGYTQLIRRMLHGIEVQLDCDFFADRAHWMSLGGRLVFTGRIDQFYDYRFGELAYRSLRFASETVEVQNYQGVAQMNYTAAEVPYTRIVEHKHFGVREAPVSIITREYPQKWTRAEIPFYPVNDALNEALAGRYRSLASAEQQVIFGGRLAEYRYYDMHQVIAAALSMVNRHLKSKTTAESVGYTI